MEKKSNILHVNQTINTLSNRIGMSKDNEKTVIEIKPTNNESEKLCILKNGSWGGDEPWFIVDENSKLHTLMSIDSLTKLVDTLKEVQQENFNLKLEKTLWKHVPVDFADAWAVAMDEIQTITSTPTNSKIVNINLNNLVKKIKKKHPNLFLDIEDFIPTNDEKNINDKL